MSFYELPDTVLIGENVIPINTDFRNGIKLSIAAKDGNINSDELNYLGISLFFGNNIILYKNIHETIENLLFFFSCGKNVSEKHDDTRIENFNQSYDFKQDATLIYAAFQKEYGIDLTTERLHWWKFIALLEPLVSGITFSEIIKCRAIKITRDMSKEEAKYYRRMKKIYAIDHQGDIASKSKRAANYDDFKTQLLERVETRRKEARKQAKEAGKRE